MLAAFSAVIISIRVEAEESAMRSPPPTMNQHEQIVDDNDASMRCRDWVRGSTIVNRPGILVSSEKISFSEEFGNIYRYDMVQSIADGQGSTHDVRSILVVWTKDCETLKFATYPTFKLPG